MRQYLVTVTVCTPIARVSAVTLIQANTWEFLLEDPERVSEPPSAGGSRQEATTHSSRWRKVVEQGLEEAVGGGVTGARAPSKESSGLDRRFMFLARVGMEKGSSWTPDVTLPRWKIWLLSIPFRINLFIRTK